MKRVLIVTPNWPPVSCPDIHRVRMALPFFQEFGWEPLILKIDPNEQEGIKDPELCRTVLEQTKTWQAGYISRSVTQWLGLKNIGLRSMFHLAQLGSHIIEAEKPSAVFFSTTLFPLMLLGRYWYTRHHVPYILDFQDPWLSNYSGSNSSLYQSWKYKTSQAIAGILEPLTLRRADHIISVSSGYVEALLNRYVWLKPEQFTVLPFGAAEADFSFLKEQRIAHTQFNPNDGKQHWVYVGRGGDDMAFAVRSLFQALAHARQQNAGNIEQVRLHFIGTDYAPADLARKTIEPIAVAYGVADLVEEYPQRIPYFEALQCLLDADALIVPGSDDPSYTASKIYPYILARKPLLAVFHENSSVVDVLRSTGAGTVVTFKEGDQHNAIAQTIYSQWLQQPTLPQPQTSWQHFTPYTAREMTRKICDIFEHSSRLV
jgi:hypothetical protein